MIFRAGQVLLFLTVADAAEKGMMRRHKVLMATNVDGSFEAYRWHLSERSEMPVENHSYKVAFEMDGKLMCWQRETDGCRQFAGDCEVKYCDPEICDCMLVQPLRCGDHMDLFTEADWDKDPTTSGDLKSKFWRGIRVQYYDPSKWGNNASVDVGKALETSLSCTEVAGCSCHESPWFHWSYPEFGGNILWTPGGNASQESIGPSGKWGLRLQPSIVVRAYNDFRQVGNMYFVSKDVAISSRSTTTTTEEEDEDSEETTESETTTSTTSVTVTTTTTTVTTTTTTTTTTVTVTTTTTTTITTSTSTSTTTSTETSTTTTTTEYLAPEYAEAAFRTAQEAGMSEAQAAEIAARVAGCATQIARGPAGPGNTLPLVMSSAMAAARAAFAAGKVAGMDNTTAHEAAAAAAGAAAAELQVAEGKEKEDVMEVAQAAATQAAEAFGGMTSAEVATAGDAAAGHASALVAGLAAQKQAMANGKSWWNTAMAAATAAADDALASKKGLQFTAAEVGAAAAGAATVEVMQALKRHRRKIIKVAGLVAKRAGRRRGMTRAEADFAAATASALAAVTTDPALTMMFTTTTSTTTEDDSED